MFRKFSSFRIVALMTLLSFCAQLFSPFVGVVFADNMTYYVDASGGSDTNDGLSDTTPWQTLAHVSNQSFLPGDQILLKCGESWTETLTISTSGADGNPIMYDSYGVCNDSNKPRFVGTGTYHIEFLSGASDVHIANIHFFSDVTTHVSLADAGNSITISDSLFRSGTTGIALGSGTGVTIIHNTFENILSTSIEAFSGSTANITGNYFNASQSGVTNAIRLGDFSTGVVVSGNTFSGATTSLAIKNSTFHTISSNTFYSPSTYALTITEDSSVPVGTVSDISVTGNIFLTWNPDYTMIRVDDQNDALGTLATLAGNTYLNFYKAVLPLVEILQNGAGTQAYSKDTINILDSSALTFTHFGYKNYTSTGVLNPRTRETYLLVNTGANSTSIACPSGALCGQYVNTNSGSVTFPKNVSAYSSEIVFWNSAPNILHLPSCVMSPLGGGTIGNGQSVVLNWSVSGATNTTIRYPTSTGFTTTAVPHTGTGEFYPPNPDGVANIYTLSGTNDIGSRVCTADIRTSNLAPVLYTFTGTGVEDALVITGQLVGTDSPGDTLSYYIDSFPLTGSLVIASDGLFEYTPPSNFCGDTTFNWNVSDGQVTGANPEAAMIHVTCVNDALIVVDDVVSGTGGVTQSIDVLLNDINPDDGYTFETFTLSGVSGPSHGTISVAWSQFEYTPDIAYFGLDSFMYVVVDQSGAVSNTGTVSLTIAPGMNFAPIVSSGSANGNEDIQIVGTFSGSDLNGDTLSFSAITLPANGTLGIAGDTYTYTPNTDFNGSDSFTFVANDGQIDSSGATIQLTLFPVEDFPVANNDTINVEMNTTSQLDVLLNDTEPDGQSITLTGISTPTNGIASIVANRIQYTPIGGYLGSDSIEYVIEDINGNLSNTGTVSISVTTTNQFPVADSGSWMTNEDTLLVASLSGSDPDATPVTFILDQNTTNGTLNLSSTGGFSYTPNLNFNGTDTFTFHVSDGVLSSPIQTLTITIASLGDAPVATPDAQSGTEDTIMTLSLLSNDTDPDVGDTLSLLSFTVPGSGSLTQSGDTLTYTPIADFCGTDSFSYTIQDGTATPSNSAMVTVSLACVNDAPLASVTDFSTIGNIITQSGNTLTGTLSGSDIDGPSLTFTLVLPGASHGSVSVTSSGYFEYTPNIGFTGSDTFDYTISDGTFSVTGTVNTTVFPNNYNAVPNAFSGSFTLSEDQVFSASLSGFDLEGVPLSFILDQNTTKGTLNPSSTGGFSYTPNLNFNGTDIFTFHVSDGVNNSLLATGTLTISPLNDAPVTVNDIASGTEDTLLSISPVLNDTDVEGSSLSLISFTTPTNGTLTQSGNTLTYDPASNYCGADTFDYTVSDGSLASNTGTVNITLACVNDVPIANNDFASTTEDTPILIPVLLNDTELDIGDTLTITNLTQPATGGTVSVSGTGVLYTPTTNFCSASPIMFNYGARDTVGTLSSTVTGTISSVTCVNDAPLAQNASYVFTSASGAVLTGSVYGNDVDGDSLNYSLQVTPFTGSISLTSTGYFEYTIPTDYSGLDTLSFLVSDGAVNSNIANINICAIPPSGTPRPACAPALPAPPTTGPTVGPGGGGGGGGSASVPTLASYDSVTVGGVKDSLVSKLLLSRTSLMQTGTVLAHNIEKLPNTSYQSLLQGITDIVNPAKNQTVTATLQTQKIRSLGRSLLQLIVRDATMTPKEKGYTISGVEEHLETLGQGEKVSPQNNRAIVYLMRFFKTKRVALLKSVSIASNFLR